MKTGLAISALMHAALLLWGLISFAARPLEAKPNDALPVDIISDKQFSEMTKGVKNAPKESKSHTPLVEKVDTPNKVDDSSAKVDEKKKIEAAKAETPPVPMPKPEPKPAEAKPEKKQEPSKLDAIAETLKKQEAKKKAEEQAKAKAEKQKNLPKFDPNQIAALLDKRAPQRSSITGDALNPDASLGKSDGAAAQLSQSEIDALRRRLAECWNPPVGAADAGKLKVVLRVLFKQDGSVASPPQLVAGTPSPYGPALAESAKRAILVCQPFTMLKAEHYSQWKDIEITFDPRDMFGNGG